MTECPECKGKGGVLYEPGLYSVACRVCKGEGKIDEERAIRILMLSDIPDDKINARQLAIEKLQRTIRESQSIIEEQNAQLYRLGEQLGEQRILTMAARHDARQMYVQAITKTKAAIEEHARNLAAVRPWMAEVVR